MWRSRKGKIAGGLRKVRSLAASRHVLTFLVSGGVLGLALGHFILAREWVALILELMVGGVLVFTLWILVNQRHRTERVVDQRTAQLAEINASLEQQIAERHWAERELADKSALLETTFENMSQGFCVYDGDHKLVAFSRKYVECVGLPEDVVRFGVSWGGIIRAVAKRGDLGPGDIDDIVKERLSHAPYAEPVQYERVRPNGKVYSVYRGPMPDGGFVTTYTDITPLKGAEESLRQAHDQLEKRVETRTAELDQVVQTLRGEIAEREAVEQSLAESETIVRSIMENVVDGIVTIDQKGRIESFNPAAESIFGYGAGEVVGRNVSMLMPEPYTGQHDGYLKSYLRTGKGKILGVGPREVTGRRRNGTTFPMDLATSEMWLGDKRLFIGVCRDITARKDAEREVGEKSALLETTLDNMVQGFCVYDSDLRLVAFNDKFIEFNDFPPGFMRLGIAREDVLRYLAERGDFGGIDVEEFVRDRIESTKKGEVFQNIHHRPDGRSFLYNRGPIPNGGFVATYTEITDQVRMERELADKSVLLETTFDNMAQGFCVYDADFKLAAYNEKYREIIDCPPGLIHIGAKREDVLRFHAERGDYGPGDIEEMIKDRLESAKAGEERLSETTRPDGMTYLYHRRPMPRGGFVSTYTDISQIKQAEQDMREARDNAEIANRAKTDFLANMSHELRTPLNAIIGFTEIMESGVFGPLGDSRYAGYLKDIHGSGRHLLELINDILDVSRIETGQIKLREEDINIAEVIKSVIRLIRQRAKESGLGLTKRVQKNLPRLRADERRVKQILLNLLSNAVKFTPKGGKIGVTANLHKDGTIAITVADTGIGIAPEDIPRMLTPFSQADSSLSRKHEGTGLGLPLTKSFVELHGGTLHIKSQPGRGTKVTVRFPASRVIGTADPGSRPSPSPEQVSVPVSEP